MEYRFMEAKVRVMVIDFLLLDYCKSNLGINTANRSYLTIYSSNKVISNHGNSNYKE